MTRSCRSDGISGMITCPPTAEPGVNAVNVGAVLTDRQRQRHAAEAAEKAFEGWCLEEAARRDIPLGRMGLPDEVAPVVALLLSPLAAYITGSAVDVAGGLGARA